jgi:hypothetical protein
MALIDFILGPKRSRAKTVERDGSPVFLYSFGALAISGGREYVELRTDIPASRKYEPLDVLDITNTSGAALTLEINGAPFGLIAQNFFFGSYTVPTARSAYLEWFDIAVIRATAASTPGKLGIMLGIVDTDAGFKIVSNSILSVSQNSINSNRYTHGGLTMLLRAGDELRYETLDYSTGGTVYYQATAKLLEFTA